MNLIIEMKGYSNARDRHEGTFEGIVEHDYSSEGKREYMRLHNKETDVVTDCPTIYILRYWYKNKWVYVSNKY